MTGTAVTDVRRAARPAHAAARLPRQLRNPYRVPRPAVISFSGGRTSGYLLKHVIDAYGGRLPDGVFVVFANTAMERQETLDFIDTCATAWSTTVHWIPDEGIRLTVTDDGDGIADPAVLLSFGESGWDEDTARREDPAGMGVYALSKRGCTISSRARGPALDLAPGWRIALTPDCFLGKEDAEVLEGHAPWPHGTAISFTACESLVIIQGAVAAAARHCPLPVTFNGEACERKAFLDGAASPSASSGTTMWASTIPTSTSTDSPSP